MLANNKKSMPMPKDAIRIRKSKKDRYSNCQKDKDKDKMTSNDLLKYFPTKTENDLRYSRMVNSSCSTNGTCSAILATNSAISHERGTDGSAYDTCNISGTHCN